MPKYSDKTIKRLNNMTEEECKFIVMELDELGVADKINEIFKVSGNLLSSAVDFMKRIGVLDDFTNSLDEDYKEAFVRIFTLRPKYCGGNPFD